MLLIMTLVGALCVSAAIQTGKSRAKTRTSLALESVFAEYDTDLLAQYHLFAYDAGRGGQEAETGVCMRIHSYGGDPELTVDKIQYLSDRSGEAIVEQAGRYMESRNMISALYGDSQSVRDSYAQEIGEQLLAHANDGLSAEIAGDILSLLALPVAQTALPRGRAVSGGRIDLGSSPSHRDLRKGRGAFKTDGGARYFDEYLMEVCDNAAEEQSLKEPAYEAEYVIAGKAADKDNLEAVVTRILAIRMAVNMSHLHQDAAKQAEIESIAAFLSLAAAVPAAQPAIKEALAAAWAYAESMAEIRALLAGKRVATVKNAQNWKVGAAGILHLNRSMEEGWETDDQEGGISYEDYLRGFLFPIPVGKKAMRLADLIEININRARGGSDFLVDRAVCRLQTAGVCRLERGVTFQYKNIFVYR